MHLLRAPLVPRPRHARRLGLLALLSAVLTLAVACGGKQQDGEHAFPPGVLYVVVQDRLGARVSGANVRTEPDAGGGEADAAGSLLLSRVPPGFYRVSATDDEGGAASKAVEVVSNEVLEVTLTLDGSVSPGSGGSGGAGGTGGTGTGGSGGSGPGGRAGAGGAAIDLDYIDAATQVEAMVVDPVRRYLYALDRVNNSFLFVNLSTREVEKTIFVGSSPVDMDFDDAGDQLFVANFGSTEIAIVDLESQEIARTIFVDPSQGTWDQNPYRIAVTAGNTLVFTGEDQWCDLKLVNATNGGHIATLGTLSTPDLLATADGTSLFAGESGGALHRYEVGEATLTEVDATVDGGTRNVVLSGNEEFVFYGGKKIRASNLKNVLGSFNDEIRVVNDDGTRAVSSTKVFDATNFAILALLPFTTTTMAVSPDYVTLYLYDITSSRIYLFDLGAI